MVCATNVAEPSETDLGDDRAEFPGGSRDTMCGGTVTSGENLTRDDECGSVGAEVLEEVGQTVEEDESLCSSGASNELPVAETHADESHGEDYETHKLYRLAAPGIDEEEGNPVSRNETSDGKDQVTDGDVP